MRVGRETKQPASSRVAADPEPRRANATALTDLRPGAAAQRRLAQMMQTHASRQMAAWGAPPAAPVQRIEIAGQDLADRAALTQESYFDGGGDPETEAVIDEYMERRPKESFDDDAAWTSEITLRTELIRSMLMIEELRSEGHLSYNDANQWVLPGDTWQTVGAQDAKKQDAAFRPRDGVSPLAAINALVTPHETETYYLDCSTAVLAAHYHALSVVLEAKRAGDFDRIFKPANPMVIAPADVQGVNLGKGMVEPPGYALAPVVSNKDVGGVDGLLPGDWVYFQNFSDYAAKHDDTAAYSGEHAVYIGAGRFVGFGAGTLSYEEMVLMLISAYNKDLKKKEDRKSAPLADPKSLSGKVPGIVEVRRVAAPGRRRGGK